jgi:hypothetical protein
MSELEPESHREMVKSRVTLAEDGNLDKIDN